VAIIITLTYAATKIIRFLVRGVFKSGVPIVAMHAERAVIILTWIFGILLAIEALGIRIDVILLLLGLGGLAGIVAFKDVMQNMVANYFNYVYMPFKLRDEIMVLGHKGNVIGINPISTILIDEEEKIISIPNSAFIREPFVNTTQAAWKEIVVPIMVPAETDLPEFESAVLKACNKLKMYWDERFPPLLTIKNRDPKNVSMELTVMVNAPQKKETAMAEINEKIMDLLQKTKQKQ
jgi:small-conductance mechanosensitive channel